MSILVQQLNKLQQNSVLSIAPGAPKPSLILDQKTANSTSIDVLLTMAIFGYGQIKKQILHNGRILVEELLSEDNKQINRNKLTSDQNKCLSIKLTNVLLIISPLFLNRGCQSIIQYLLRNYNIHIFQRQQVALIYLQYWQHESYIKLLKNIKIKSTNLQFLKKIQQKQQINFTYIIKSITYSRSLLDSLIAFTKKYIKQESTENEQIQIYLQTKPTISPLKIQQSTYIKHDIKKFLLQVLTTILQRKITTFNKQICELCIFGSKQESQETESMAIILAISVLESQPTQSQWIDRVLRNLLNKSAKISQNVFNFVIVIWQRWPTLINHELINILIVKQNFVTRLTDIKKSVFMVFLLILQYFLQPKQLNKGIAYQLISALCLKVKSQQFVKVHEITYFSHIFKLIHSHLDKLQQKQQKIVNNFITNFLLYEYAQYINQNKINPLQGIFLKQQFSKNGSINLSLFTRVQLQEKVQQQPEIHNKHYSAMDQQSEEQQSINKNQQSQQNSTILKVINQCSKKKYDKFDISFPQIKNLIIKLINDYYSQMQHESEEKVSLTTAQKNRLLENPTLFSQLYNIDRFYFDLEKNDYPTCIRFLLISGNAQMCYKVLIKLIQNKEITDDLLYRQLCRQAIQKLSQLAINYCTSVIKILGKLYHNYCQNSQVELLMAINEKMLKLSAKVISPQNKGKGKFYKLVVSHAKILAKLTLSQIYSQSYALQTYHRLLDIFGADNCYCFLIGAAQMLAKMEKDNKQFGNFVDKILIPSLHVYYQQQNQPQLKLFRNIVSLFQAFNKCLIFSYYMLNQSKPTIQSQEQNIKEEKSEIKNKNKNNLSYIQSGVAQKMIVTFFGLTTSKEKRGAVRNILLFLADIFRSQKLAALFKQTLQVIKKKQELKLTTTTSKIYRMLVKICNETRGPLKEVTELVKVNMLKLFPLELKIDVLGPLLPLNEGYAQLATSLQQHSSCKFQNLAHLINIVPTLPSEQWCNFTTQCLKRGYSPNQQSCNSILKLTQFPKYRTNIIKFICNLSEYDKQKCLKILDQIMKIIMNECTQYNDYTLAIFYVLTKNLKELIDPYLSDIFKIAIQIHGDYINQFIDGIVQVFTAPTLVSLAKNHAKNVQNFDNFSNFLQKISNKVTFESVWKTSQNFFARSLSTLIQQQKLFNELHEQQAVVFLNQALKMNDNQLRKIIIDYVRWASEKTNSDDIAHLHFNARKNLLLTIFIKLSDKLGDLFTHFYGYIFEDIVKDLKSLTIMQEMKTNLSIEVGGRRPRQFSQYGLECCAKYLKQLLTCLKNLFQHDPSNQFMDSIKFDTLSPEIVSVFNMVKFDQHYNSIMSDSLLPCLISLFKNTADDYKLKTINTEILRQLRTKNHQIISTIFNFYDEVVAHIEYRFLLFTDQMIPLLIEASSTRNVQIKKSVESIIYKVQNLSGQKIDTIHR